VDNVEESGIGTLPFPVDLNQKLIGDIFVPYTSVLAIFAVVTEPTNICDGFDRTYAIDI